MYRNLGRHDKNVSPAFERDDGPCDIMSGAGEIVMESPLNC
jgi:hypothetical protein